MARITAAEAGGIDVLAFLDLLAWSELKPALIALSDEGYNVVVGSTPSRPILFTSYADHPKKYIKINAKLTSSAAGRYQFLERTWRALARDRGFKDFSPRNQDLGAIHLLKECKAYSLVVVGNIEAAIQRAAPIWASLPGAGYGQHENRIADLMAVFTEALERYRRDFSNVEAGVDTTAPLPPEAA